MDIKAVNTASYSAKTSSNKKKSENNSAKIFGTGVGFTYAIVSNWLDLSHQAKIESNSIKNVFKANKVSAIYSFLFSTLTGLGIGAIVDEIVNSKNIKTADNKQ